MRTMTIGFCTLWSASMVIAPLAPWKPFVCASAALIGSGAMDGARDLADAPHQLLAKRARKAGRVRVFRDVEDGDALLVEALGHPARGDLALLIVGEADAEHPLAILRHLDGGGRRRDHRHVARVRN